MQAAGAQTGTMSMGISNLVAGQQYSVHLEAAQRPGYPVNPFTVAVNGTVLATVTPGQGFASYATQSFTAGGTTGTLVLSTTPATQDSASGIDSITIVPLPTVADASFETPSLGSGGYQYNPNVAGVVFSSSAGIAANGSAWGFPSAPDGSQVAFLQSGSGSTASISMSVTGLTAGHSYTVAFQASHRPNFGVDPVKVSVNENALITVNPPDQFTQYQTPPFTVSSASANIEFSVGNASGDSGSGIDAVSVLAQ